MAGRSEISQRLATRFHNINFTFPDDNQIRSIFVSLLSPRLSEFEDEVKGLAGPVVAATGTVFSACSASMGACSAVAFHVTDVSGTHLISYSEWYHSIWMVGVLTIAVRICVWMFACAVAVYTSVVDCFLPTPRNCHYLFNMRDIAKVVQGVMQSDKKVSGLFSSGCCLSV